MVRRFIDMDAFEKGFRSAKERSLKAVSLPRGLSMKMFHSFQRVMEAADAAEIKDISAGELAALYVRAEALVSVICSDSVLENPEGLMCEIMKASAVRLQRRIL